MTNVRSSMPRCSRVEDQLSDRSIHLLMHASHSGVPFCMCVPMQERNVLGCNFDKSSAGFDQTTCEQTSLPEATGVVFGKALFRLECDIERGSLGEHSANDMHCPASAEPTLADSRSSRPVAGCYRATCETVYRDWKSVRSSYLLADAPTQQLDPDYGKFIGPYSEPKNPAVVNAFNSSLSPDAFEPLTDINEGWNNRIARPKNFCDPTTDVRTGDRLWRDVTGVPVILMTRM